MAKIKSIFLDIENILFEMDEITHTSLEYHCYNGILL